MEHTANTLPTCPVETTLTLISSKWKVLILRDLLGGARRFGELRRSVGGVSQKVLTAQLREMEDSGLLTRTVFPEVPPHVEYALTELGYSLKPVLDAMWSWGEAYQAREAGAKINHHKNARRRRRRAFSLVGPSHSRPPGPASWASRRRGR